METFRPGAVVLQMGADSLSGDKLGGFNLTLQGMWIIRYAATTTTLAAQTILDPLRYSCDRMNRIDFRGKQGFDAWA